jgi:hypothetical protein
MNIVQENKILRETVNNLVADVNTWRGFLAIVLKSQGGFVSVEKEGSEVDSDFEIAVRINQSETKDSVAVEFKLLEGKEEIEKIFGKPSPIVVPR